MFKRIPRLLAPAMMKAVVTNGTGDSSVLELKEVPTPELKKEHDIRIKVAAIGVNRVDLSQRRGTNTVPPDASPYLGVEVSGTVEQVGPAVTRFKEGDNVMALVNGGGYAEYCTTGEHTALPIPHGYTFVEAAAIPESFLSAWMLLKFYGKVQEGQRVLIHAGSSNLGMAASQITETIMKATAITTSSSEHIPVCKRFASIAISRKPNVFGDHFCGDVRAAIGDGVGVDVVIDPIFGGTYTQENAALLSDYGKILVVSYVGGARLTMNALPLYRQRARISFCQLRTMTDTFKKELVQSFEEQVIPYMNEKMVIPTVFRSFPLDQVATVHTMLDENKQRSAGKYVLTVEETASRSSAAGTQ